MGSKDKLVERFKKKPKDFTYEETVRFYLIKEVTYYGLFGIQRL